MSLNKALGEMFKVIRDEAARNPEFAARLADALALSKPPRRRRTPRAEPAAGPPPAPRPFDLSDSLARPAAPGFAEEPIEEIAAETPPPSAAPALNPIAILSREGPEALRRRLAQADYPAEALAALIAEHNLDPSGLAAGADAAGLIDQIVSQAAKRVERDKALFNY